MKNKLKITNLTIGIAVVILFAITGQLMRHYYLNETAPDVERLYRRSRHLYLLLVGLAQGGIGVYIIAHQHKIAHLIQWLATGLMTLGSACLIYAFFYEIPQEIIKTPVSRIAMYILLASAVLHLGSSLLNQFKQSKSNPS
jgi:glucan phosphoethanolaminetransferase (alkaline phosphatase superfamily)